MKLRLRFIEVQDLFRQSGCIESKNKKLLLIPEDSIWERFPDSITGDPNRQAFYKVGTCLIFNRNANGQCSIGYKGNEMMNAYVRGLKLDSSNKCN